MGKRKLKLSKRLIAVIITISAAVVFVCAVLITNIFVPLRYLPAYCVKARPNEEGSMRVTFVDVGFGDCVLAELPDGKNMLIDGGDGAYAHNTSVLRTLNACGVDKLDYLVCTSVKTEHSGGLAEVVRYKKVAKAFLPYSTNPRITDGYRAVSVALEKCGAEIAYACIGEGICAEDYVFAFLSPTHYSSPTSEYVIMNATPNAENIDNASAVCCLQWEGISFIFTSDARKAILGGIADSYRLHRQLGMPFCAVDGRGVTLENCTVVTVAAHGGEDSSCASFYDLLTPRDAVVSVGKNFAGYPSQVALGDINAYCKPKYTMFDGNITYVVRDGEYTVTGQDND